MRTNTQKSALTVQIMQDNMTPKDIKNHAENLETYNDLLYTMDQNHIKFVSQLDKFINGKEKLTATCSHGHWFSAKYDRFVNDEPCMFCEMPELQEQVTAAFEEGCQQGIAEVEERIEYESLMTLEDHHQAIYDDAMADQMREEPYTTDWDLS